MKRLLLLACTFISLSTISQAQITKGSILLGGSIGLSNGKNTGTYSGKENNIYFNPTVGIAIKENWIVGISGGFSNYNGDPGQYTPERNGESYSGGLFARRYTALGKNFYLYGNGSLTYNKVDHSEFSSTNNYANYYRSKGVVLSLAPGITYAVNKWLHLEASLNDLLTVDYTTSNRTNISQSGGITSSNSINNKSFGFDTNFNTTSPFSIGFRFVIAK